MVAIKTVGIFSKPRVPAAAELIPKLMEWLGERGIVARYDVETAGYLDGGKALPRTEVPDGCELVIVLGGDGTLLSAARAISGKEIPLFAVNLGGLGFLTAISLDDVFPELERAFRGEHRIGRRRLLRADLYRRDERIGRYDALNDVVMTKSDIAHGGCGSVCQRSTGVPLQGRRADRFHANRVHRLFAVRGRSDYLSLGGSALHHADLSSHAD
jgi:NAD+ kinase